MKNNTTGKPRQGLFAFFSCLITPPNSSPHPKPPSLRACRGCASCFAHPYPAIGIGVAAGAVLIGIKAQALADVSPFHGGKSYIGRFADGSAGAAFFALKDAQLAAVVLCKVGQIGRASCRERV